MNHALLILHQIFITMLHHHHHIIFVDIILILFFFFVKIVCIYKYYFPILINNALLFNIFVQIFKLSFLLILFLFTFLFESKCESSVICLYVVLEFLLFAQESVYKFIVDIFQFLKHYGHYSDIIIVY